MKSLLSLALVCLCLCPAPVSAACCGKGAGKLVHRLLHPFAHLRNRGL